MRQLKTIFTILFVLTGMVCFDLPAQAPQAFFLNKTQAPAGELLSISGSNFGGDESSTVVQFGAARGTVTLATNNTIEVLVPPGATYSNISVTNTNNGLTSYSFQQFGLNYNSVNFDISLLQNAGSFPATTGLIDITLMDLDIDGKSDIITTGNASSSFIILRNTSTPANVNFTAIPAIPVQAFTTGNTAGDLDGDGLPEVAVCEGGNVGRRVFLYRNTSTPGNITLTPILNPLFSLNNNASRILIKDLDFDGKPDIVVTHESANTLSIFRNTSTPGNLTFENAFALAVTGAPSSTGLAIEDLNLDGLPEIVVNTFLNDNVYVFNNISTASGLAFEEPVVLDVPGNLVTLRLADFNGDDLPDIVVSELLSGRVFFMENQSSVENRNVAFGVPNSLSTVARPWGIAAGEVDGDGKVDLVVASIQNNSVSILTNTTAEGEAISFERVDIDAGEITRNVQIGDINGDGKADIALTGIASNQVITFVNRNCFVPQVSPFGDFEICPGFPLTLNTLDINGATFDWQIDGVSAGNPGSSIDASNPGSYTVVTTSEGGACVNSSEAVIVSLKPGTAPDPVTATNGGLVCQGETAQLFASDLPGATYLWEGPQGFTSSDQNPVVSDFTVEKAGRYTVEVTVNQCQSTKDTTLLETSPLPFFAISGSDSVGFCEGKSVALEVNSTPGFSIQWKQDGAALTGETGSSYTASTSGAYSVDVTNTDNCIRETPDVIVLAIPPPIASFIALDSICVGDTVQFTNTSQISEGIGAFYSWDFGNGKTSTGAEPSVIYDDAGSFAVSLKVNYSDQECKDSVGMNILVGTSPTFDILASPDTVFCADTVITLTSSEVLAGYLWSTGETTQSIEISDPGSYLLVGSNEAGCSSQNSISTSTFDVPVVTISADTNVIIEGDQLELMASGASSYQWEPAGEFEDPSLAVQMIMPAETTIYSVTGTDDNGCQDGDELTVTVNPDPTGGALVPAKFFSPNGDGQNDVWTIENIDDFPDCVVLIFNRQGKVLMEQKGYQNDWDGTLNGTELRTGVYYFAVQCDGQNSRTGSITLVR